MRTFHAVIKSRYSGVCEYDLAAKTFGEAIKKIKGLVKRDFLGKYRIKSLTETAELDA